MAEGTITVAVDIKGLKPTQDLHAAVYNAVALLNCCQDAARLADVRRAHDMLRQALGGEPMTTAKTMQDNGAAQPAVGSRLDRTVSAVRYGWTPSGMIEDYNGPWIVATEIDCHTCRNFRGTQHCHSILRCVDGSSYQRVDVVQLWETAPVDVGF